MKKTTALLILLCFTTGLLAQQPVEPGFCPAPLNPQSVDVTNSSAVVKWEPPSSQYHSFTLEYKKANDPYKQINLPIGRTYFKLTMLRPNTMYFWRVKVAAFLCNGINVYWASGTFQTTVCDLPTNLNTESVSTTSATVSWNTVGTARYVVEHKKTGALQWIVNNDAWPGLYTFSNLAPGTRYDWRIKSECQLGNSSYVYAQFETPCNLVPQNLSCSENTTSSISVRWSAIPNITDYTLEYKTVSSFIWTILGNTPSTSGIIEGILPNTAYMVRVKANCPTGSSNYALTQCTTLPPPCNAPVILQPTIGVNTTTINWNGVANAASYLYQYKVAAATTWSNEQTATSTSAILTGLNPSTRYDYRVRTNCAYGLSAYATGQFITLCTEPVLRTPYAVTTSSATVNWNEATGAGSYTVEYKPQASSTWLAGGVTSNTVLILNALTANTLYDYRVKPNCGNYVVGQFATQPVTGCAVPQGLAVNSITGSTAHVSWTPVIGATHYVFYYSRYGFLPSTITATNTSLDIANLTPGTDYTVYLSAKCGAASSLEVFVPFKTAAISSCSPPTNITVLATSPATSTLTWGRSAGATNYTIAYEKIQNNILTLLPQAIHQPPSHCNPVAIT